MTLLQRLREERAAKLKEYGALRSKYGEKPTREWETADRTLLTELHERTTELTVEIALEEAAERQARIVNGATESNTDARQGSGPSNVRDANWAFGQLMSARSQQEFSQRAAMVQRDMQVDIPDLGGFISMPQAVSQELIQDARRDFVVRSLARNFGAVAREGLGAQELNQRVNFTWGTELSLSSAQDLRFGKRSLAPKDFNLLCKVSRPLLTESNVDSIVRSEMSYAKGYGQEDGFFNGNGVGGPLGLLYPSADGIPTSQDFTSTVSGSFDPDDLIDMMLKTIRPAYFRDRSFAVIASADGFASARKMKDDDGQYIFTPTGSIGDSMTSGVAFTLLGKPLYISEFMPVVAAGNYPFIAGAMRHYGIVDGLDDSVQLLIELYAAENKNGYLMRGSCDGAPMKDEAFARLKVKV